MADGFVQVLPDSSGKKVDTAEVTRADGSTVVERQRVVLSDPNQPTNADVSVGARGPGLSVRFDDALTELIEIRSLLTQLLELHRTVLH